MTLSSEEKLNKKREYERNYKKSEKFKKKRREYERNYRKTQKFKAKRRKLIKRKYDRDPQYKIKQNELNKKWRKTEKGKISSKKTNANARARLKKDGYFKRYENNRKKKDIIYKLKFNLKARLSVFLKSKKIKKTNKTFELVGCTPEELRRYLESKWLPGMTWKNHSLKGWHIDHIIPLDKAKNENDLKRLYHYTNLQPLWARKNILKSNK